MNVVVNGEAHEIENGATVSALLAELELNEKKVAVELNQAVVVKDQWDTAELHGGDLLVDSPGLGKGTTFTLLIPLEPAGHGG